MAEAGISIEIVGMNEWLKLLESMIAKGRQFDKLLIAAFMTYGFKDIISHFRDEEGPQGKWAPRSPWTQKMYAQIAEGEREPPDGMRRGSFSPSNKLLQLTGQMRQSISGGTSQNIQSHGRDAILVKSHVEYSGKHDEGDPANRIPQRQFMWLSDRATSDMGDAILRLLMDEGSNAV